MFEVLCMHEWVSEVAQSCPTLCDPIDCSLPGSSIHGIFQARILEWVAISFSGGSSQPRDRTLVSRIAGRRFTVWAIREILMYAYLNLYSVFLLTPVYSFPIGTSWLVGKINFLNLEQVPVVQRQHMFKENKVFKYNHPHPTRISALRGIFDKFTTLSPKPRTLPAQHLSNEKNK